MQLRPYQNNAIVGTLSVLKTERAAMVQVPTGGGKTVIALDIIRRCMNMGYPLLFLAHREELLTQAHKTFLKGLGVNSGIIQGGRPMNLDLPIQIASVQTFVNMVDNGFAEHKDFKVIIIDEAHHCAADTYVRIVEAYPNAKIIGLSATPYRLDGTGFTKWFNKLVTVITVKELEETGFLVPADLFADKMDASGLVVKRGEYDAEQIGLMLSDYQVLADCLKSWRDHAEGKRTICFASTIPQSKLIVEYFNAHGVPSAHVDGSTKDRAKIFADLESGKILFLSNVAIATEGFDEPSIECVVLLRKTKSLSLYLQMVGRGSRLYTCPTTGRKKEVYTLLDFCDNWIEHDVPNFEHDWNAHFIGQEKKKGKKKKEEEEGKQYVMKLETGEEVTLKLEDIPKGIKGVSLVRIIQGDKKLIKTANQKEFDKQLKFVQKMGWKPYATYYRWRKAMIDDNQSPTTEDFDYLRRILNMPEYWTRNEKTKFDNEVEVSVEKLAQSLIEKNKIDAVKHFAEYHGVN